MGNGRRLLAGIAVALGALVLGAGTANAASRGFEVVNNSGYDLILVGPTAVPAVLCGGPDAPGFNCVPADYDMGFEGQPADNSDLAQGTSQRWELDYYYNAADLFGVGINYAADLKYQIKGTADTLELIIETTNYENDSTCVAVPAGLTCDAEGLTITIGSAATRRVAARATAHASAKRGRTENISLVSTTSNGTFSAIATGAFTDGGTARLRNGHSVVYLSKGQIELTHTPGKPSRQVDPKTCLGVVQQSGTYKLISGTGAYQGIRGSGRYTGHYTALGKPVEGKCQDGLELAAQLEIVLRGRVSL